jgi:hypothetical protein
MSIRPRAKKATDKSAGRVARGPEKKSGEFVADTGAVMVGGNQETEKTEEQAVAMEELEQKRKRGSGLEQLKRAADQRLRSASDALADLLLEKAKEGKVDNTRLLVRLAEGKKERKPREKKKKRSKTSLMIEQLCSEPEWVEEQPEVGDVWVGDGWKNEKTGRFVPAPR